MYKRKKIDKKYIFLIVAIIVIILFAFVFSILKTKKNLNAFEKIVKDVTLSIGSIVYKPINFISDKIEDSKEKNNIHKKYEKIKEKYDELKIIETKNKELEKTNDELKKLLDIQNDLLDYEKINATIISRNVGYWYETFTVDKGEKHGIKKDMAVINYDGLIGKVISTSNLYSTIRLLTSEELGQKISVKIDISDKKYVYGLLSSYDKENNLFIIEGISENVKIPDNAKVSTTGMSDIFPAGILIGTVSGIRKDNFDLTMLVEVKPSVNFDDINYVAILKRKVEVDD